MFEVVLFMLLVATFSLGVGSILYAAFFSDEQQGDVLTQKVEYAYLGVTGVVISLVLLYAL